MGRDDRNAADGKLGRIAVLIDQSNAGPNHATNFDRCRLAVSEARLPRDAESLERGSCGERRVHPPQPSLLRLWDSSDDGRTLRWLDASDRPTGLMPDRLISARGSRRVISEAGTLTRCRTPPAGGAVPVSRNHADASPPRGAGC